MNEEPKKRGRGLGKKPALICTSIRIDSATFEWFRRNYPDKPLTTMRAILSEFVKNQGEQHGKEADQDATHPQATQAEPALDTKGGSQEGASNNKLSVSGDEHST